jgi:hypothetical protein
MLWLNAAQYVAYLSSSKEELGRCLNQRRHHHHQEAVGSGQEEVRVKEAKRPLR